MVFVAPIVVTAFSPFFLGEKLGLHRSVAVLVGFAGVFIILRPDFGGERVGYIIGFAAGFCLGLFHMANRKLYTYQPQLVAVTYTALLGALMLTPIVPFNWVTPRMLDSHILVAFLILSTVGQILLISAFSYAAASTLAPFQFTQMVAATIVGVIIFDTFPDAITWLGISFVVLAGLYIALRETIVAKQDNT